ncbi:unnamed protein product [Cuscuta campestris]|uniref:Uncharacterized protein n=1 Tax=Cuscuta campestris TaxID=132261 RepID=A0A484MT55_9ASTE|nr:unnamed protein product [Cuscuta campestris]
MGESTVIIIKPQMDCQPIEDKEEINLALKANDVDQLRRLPPPPTYLESPPYILLPPSRRDESRILDLDRAITRWYQKRFRKVEESTSFISIVEQEEEETRRSIKVSKILSEKRSSNFVVNYIHSSKEKRKNFNSIGETRRRNHHCFFKILAAANRHLRVS